jgi:outer membrane protein OmpA-like peptidoglycan-associated protein/tetratricopeptide (TPR) repeat protein
VKQSTQKRGEINKQAMKNEKMTSIFWTRKKVHLCGMKPWFLLALLFVATDAASQESCAYEASSKIQKWIEQSKDTKKYSGEERLAFLDKALEEDPNCLPCLMRLGELEFLRSKRSGASFQSAKLRFETLHSICAEYHSESWYFLGAMYYADKEYEKAEEAFEKFLRFPDSDPSKFEKDYQKKYDEVEEALKSVKAYAAIYRDPIDYQPRKVAGVSSGDDDYLPLISPDGEIMFFTRKKFKQAKGDYETRLIEEFTWCKRPDINATFDQGNPLPEPFNLGDSYGGATVSVDNKEMIVAKKNPKPNNPQNIDLFSTRYERSTDKAGNLVYTWSELQDLGPNINTDSGWEAQPSLSGDGQFLFFAAVREECMKDANGNFSHDLFFSERQPDGTWSVCKPLPSNINTRGQEKAPFMHSDSRTLYFSSNGHISVGGMDLFYCKLNEDGSFSAPTNIGYPINNEEDQLGIIVASDGELAYFGANKLNGEKGWDIYEFKMPEKAKPERVAIMKGAVTTPDQQPVQAAAVEIKYAQSGESEKVKVNADDGTYAAIVKLNKKEDVLLTVEGEGIAFNSRIISRKENEKQPVVMKLDMEAAQENEDTPFVINDIVYTTNKAEIQEDSKLILVEFAAYLKKKPELRIEIRGHTDNVGNDQSNMALSADRAFEVLNYLASLGVEGTRMTAKGFGETRPIADNETEEGRKKNRRTEFVIVRK